MLPSRPRLQSWNPDSLSAAAAGVSAGGEAVYNSIRKLDDDIDRMPEAKAWGGRAHEAATHMFGRATRSASDFKNYTEGVATALKNGSGSLAAVRTALLNKASEIDQSELHVTDQWVVLIKPGQMSAEKAANLQKLAQQEQSEVNQLLTAVGHADDDAAAAVQAAAKSHGFVPPDPHNPGTLISGQGRPGDEVPDPSSPVGLMQQEMVRGKDEATTIREVAERTVNGDQHLKTVTMLDGSKHEILEWNDYCPCVEDTYYDKNGKRIYSAFSQDNTRLDGTKMSSITYGDGTEVNMTQGADGQIRGGVTTPDGRHGVLPDEFFTHPNLAMAGGMLTGIENQAHRGIPMMTPSSMENVAKSAKFGGYGLGVATALYDTVTAKTLHDACVATVSGGAGIVGGDVLGTAFAGLFAESGPGAAVAAAGGSMLGSWTFGYVGGVIGNLVCP